MMNISVILSWSQMGPEYYEFNEYIICAFAYTMPYLCTDVIAPALIMHQEINQKIALSAYFLRNMVQVYWNHISVSAFAGRTKINVPSVPCEQFEWTLFP